MNYLDSRDYPEMLFLSETWLSEEETNFYRIPGYQGIFSCRNSHGGGSAIYIKDHIEFTPIPTATIEHCNITGIYMKDLNYNFYSIYRAPKNKIDTFLPHINTILEKKPNSVIIGDFNLNLLKKDKSYKKYSDTLFQNYFEIKNKGATRVCEGKGTVIDHIIAPKNLKSKINYFDVAVSDHKMIYAKFIFKNKIKDIKIVKYKTSTDYKKFNTLLLQRFQTGSIKGMDELIKYVQEAKIASTNKKKISIKSNKHWFNHSIKQLIKKRDKMYKKMKKFPNNENCSKFKKLKNKVTLVIQKTKKHYISNRFRNAQNNPKKTWNIINSLVSYKTNKTTKLSKIIINEKQYTLKKTIADKMNKFFVNIARTLQKTNIKKKNR